MATYLYAFGGVIVVSLISLVGVFTLSLREDILRKYIFVLISLAIGALLGDAFIHLIPEAFEEAPGILTSVLIIAGILVFFVMEKALHWHHHGEDPTDRAVHPVGQLVLFSDGVHNFLDGVIIGISFLISVPVGLATTLAVILHEIPQEIGDFAVLLHAGYTKARALWLNFVSALLAVAGVAAAFLLGEAAGAVNSWLLPLATGGFIYISLADLLPELQKTKEGQNTLLQILAIVIGVGSMVALALLE
jgi:zinc and cadmium transporter